MRHWNFGNANGMNSALSESLKVIKFMGNETWLKFFLYTVLFGQPVKSFESLTIEVLSLILSVSLGSSAGKLEHFTFDTLFKSKLFGFLTACSFACTFVATKSVSFESMHIGSHSTNVTLFTSIVLRFEDMAHEWGLIFQKSHSVRSAKWKWTHKTTWKHKSPPAPMKWPLPTSFLPF